MAAASFLRCDGAVMLRRLALLAAMLVGIGLILPARADSEDWFRPCIMKAESGDRAAALFDRVGRFDCRSRQRTFPVGTYWLVSPPLRAQGDRDYTVRFSSNWSVEVTLYVRYADGAIRRMGFTHRDAPHYLGVGGRYLLSLPTRQAAPVRLLWRVHQLTNVRGVIANAELVDDPTLASWMLRAAIGYALSAGMALALIVGHLALYVALRERFVLIYVGLMTILLGLLFVSSGAMTMLLPDLNIHLRQKAVTVLSASGVIMILLFGRSFFPAAVFTPGLRRFSAIAIGALVVSMTAMLLLLPGQAMLLDDIDSGLHLLVMAIVPVVLARAWAQRQWGLMLFAAGWGLPILLAGLRLLVVLGLVRGAAVYDLMPIVMMTLEALVGAVGIVWRIHRLGQERDTARAEEIAARMLADTDPLTGLLNRRAFLSRAIGREGDQLLLLIDIDHFKAINDRVGHDSGDEVLRGFAQALRMVAPADTLVARLGGEEFALLLPAAAAPAPAAIHRALREVRMPFGLTVTCSLGTCTGPMTSERAWQAMYRAADRALYEAKSAGRDRVRIGQPLIAMA